MEWEQAVGYYEKRLSQALDIHKYALRLTKMSQVGLPASHREELEEVEKPAKIQLGRLKRREFRIAVVGLEKAGKSTFVNAWLEKDLLPHENRRCTFSTTEIHSVSNNENQRLKVRAKTEVDFENLIKELEKKAQEDGDSARNAENDLKTIKENSTTLQEIVDRGDQVFNFERLETVEKDLKKYVADPAYAHAVKEVRLHTSRIAPLDGVVFFDVPGLDSGLGKHLEDSKNMLQDCDAVICIQKSKTPSLRAGEQKLIEYVKTGDTDVELGDKLFVFLSHIDGEGTPESLKKNIKSAKEEWKRYGLDNPERIVSGSAAAYLFIKGAAGEILKENVGDSSIENLLRITENPEDKAEEASGIPLIKEKINNYLKTERVRVLEKRCERLISRIKEPSRKILETLSEKFPEDPDEAIKNEESRRIEKLLRWWRKEKWVKIKDALNQHRKNIFGEVEQEEDTTLSKFKKRYESSVKDGMRTLSSRNEERRNELFSALEFDGHTEDWTYANYEWRKKLYIDVMDCIEDVARQLSNEILMESEDLIAKMAELLWKVDVKRVQKKIIESRKELENRIFYGLRTLFLRFSRPVAEVLISAPHGTEKRKGLVKRLGPDMDLIDPYYDGKEAAYECLKKFVNYGEALLYDPKIRKKILGVATAAIENTIDGLKVNSAKAKMIREVETDLKALEEYFVNAIFSAAGLVVFRKQEIERLCDCFTEEEHIWRELLKEEYYSNNPVLLSEMPEECRQKAFDTEAHERLKQLRIAFSKFGSIGI